MMTLGQMAAKLLEVIPTITPTEARRRLNVAYLRNSEAHAWQHLIKRFTLQTEASYNTGTLTVTEGSAAVALADGTWVASWSTAPSMRRIAIQGRNEPYDITVTGAAAGTLADLWIGDDDADATYRLFRDQYPLPTDCGYAKVLALYDPDSRCRLSFVTQPRYIDAKSCDPTLTGTPEIFTVVHQTTETPPRPQIQVYPAPSAVRAYHGWYFRRPAFLTADAQYFDWPEEFEDMHWIGAAIEYYEMPRTYSPRLLGMLRPKYADLFRQMKTQMDGQSAIDFQIASMFGGGRSQMFENFTVTGAVSWE